MLRPWYNARVLFSHELVKKITLMADSRLFCAAFMFGLTKYAFEVVIRRMPESRSSFRAAASSSRIKLEIKIYGRFSLGLSLTKMFFKYFSPPKEFLPFTGVFTTQAGEI